MTECNYNLPPWNSEMFRMAFCRHVDAGHGIGMISKTMGIPPDLLLGFWAHLKRENYGPAVNMREGGIAGVDIDLIIIETVAAYGRLNVKAIQRRADKMGADLPKGTVCSRAKRLRDGGIVSYGGRSLVGMTGSQATSRVFRVRRIKALAEAMRLRESSPGPATARRPTGDRDSSPRQPGA